MTHYSASKGGVIAFSTALARELSPATTVDFVATEDADFYAGWVFSPNGGVVM